MNEIGACKMSDEPVYFTDEDYEAIDAEDEGNEFW